MPGMSRLGRVKDGGLGMGSAFLKICSEQEEAQLPVPFIFQLCTIFLFPILFLPFASFPSPPPHISFFSNLFSPHFLFHPQSPFLSLTHPSSFPFLLFSSLSCPCPPSPSSWGRRQFEGFPLCSQLRGSFPRANQWEPFSPTGAWQT